jgi:outer membrane protein assembly factor BamB
VQKFSPKQGKWFSFELPSKWSLKNMGFTKGTLVICPNEENTLGDTKPLIGLDSETGQVLWKVESDGIKWTGSAVDKTIACAVDSRGQVAIVHPRSGKPYWKRFISLENFPRLGIPPVLSPSFLLITTPMGELLWLSRFSGMEEGKYLPSTGGLDYPPSCEEDIAFFCAGEILYRLDLNTGQATGIFRAPRKSSSGWYFSTPLVTLQGLIILHADLSEKNQPSYAIQLIDPESGKSKWKISLRRHPYFSPAIDGEFIALPDRNGHVLIIELTSGKVLSHLKLNEEKPASPPVFLNGELFILTELGKILCFSPHLHLENLPDEPKEYLQRGEWELAALKYALQGNLRESAQVYKSNKCYREAQAIFEILGNSSELGLLEPHSIDFHITLKPYEDTALQEELFALLEVEIENSGTGTAQKVQLSLTSDQMDITKSKYRFGDLPAGSKKKWGTLQVRPHAGGSLLLRITLSYQDEHKRTQKVSFERGLQVLRSQQTSGRVVNVTISGDMKGNLVVGDENRIQ